MADADRTDQHTAAAGALRTALVRRIVAAGGLADREWRAAFEEVPRHLFVPEYYRPQHGGGYERLSADDSDPLGRARWLTGAYEDEPLVTHVRNGRLISSSSQPSLMASMAEALEVRKGRTVLEIGAGTGYNAALLAHRLGGDAVTTVDLDSEITDAARAHLAAAGGGALTVITGDGALGHPGRAPYDRIVATCELPSVPAAWLRQCRPGGRILAPFAGGLIHLTVTGPDRAEGHFLHTPAYFVSLRGPAAATDRPDSGAAGPPAGAEERIRTSRTPPRVLEDDLFRFLLTLQAGELEVRWASADRGVAITAPDGSSARADRDGTVLLAGPRDLWAIAECAHDLWRRASRPPRDRFGLSVEGARQWTWLDAPDGPHVWEVPAA
ncbi:methyltransferase domain-containing protein [Streptomyces sp. H10-C2]|uniref:methyltransferase domain-containing protein n=1 Tax=unclassified Streptomyces TaxID=2593676 RepID=UPI0024B98468|nr:MULTISPECIES: methyltransferase domain-containing protein [unclassified Streptomyces]MDJ0340076.1 methyltransferase domain-containing protein [Streptomyces sp. PH10-H1]MDJ0369287.1 methyltransferase domain-containing protein [Streptomyces sp. H10-C2]